MTVNNSKLNIMPKERNMWSVQYKPNNDSQEWNILDSYDNKATALDNAYRVSAEYFIVKVTDIDESVIWGN